LIELARSNVLPDLGFEMAHEAQVPTRE